MTEKTIFSKKKLTKLDASLITEKCSDQEDVKVPNSKSHRCLKARRTVKLPRQKLTDLVAQVTEENTHGEISIGPIAGNEV